LGEEDQVARVHCIDCATTVIADPAGRCPEGHLVGAAGARIETALGRDVEHPDEPVPWIAEVVLDAPEPEIEAPRPIRPVSVGTVDPAAADEPADSDALLRELHSLSGITDGAEAADDGIEERHVGMVRPVPGQRRDPVGPAEPAATTPAESAATTPARPRLAAVPERRAEPATSIGPAATPDTGDVLSELTALEAAVQALDERSVEPAEDQLAAIDHLIAAAEASPAVPPPPAGPPAAPPPAPEAAPAAALADASAPADPSPAPATPTPAAPPGPMSFTARTGGRRAVAEAKGKRRRFGR
jgi:hypothetical protein